MTNYNNKKFRPVHNSDNGELDNNTIFNYQQKDNILTCTYSGGTVLSGHLIGTVDKDGKIEMSYHQINTAKELRTGICNSTPEIMPDGRIRLHESWQWTNGDQSKGNSILEEVI